MALRPAEHPHARSRLSARGSCEREGGWCRGAAGKAMCAHAYCAGDPPKLREARLGAFYCTYGAFFMGLSTGQGHGMTQHAVKNYMKFWNKYL